MKKWNILVSILLTLVIFFPIAAFAAESDKTDESGNRFLGSGTARERHILVAYFSATGNTEKIAGHIRDILGAEADVYKIEAEIPYTSADLDYGTDCRANREQNNPSARPAISGSVEHMEQYDVVLLGYPIWWGQAPKIIYTFMESYDLSGKTILPFCTSGSSQIGTSAQNLHALCTSSVKWLDGRRFGAGASRQAVEDWIADSGIRMPEGEIPAVKSINLSKTSFTFNGKNQRPSVTVMDSLQKRLKEGTDYTLTYPASSKNAGVYTVTIRFQGNYSGTETRTFQILPKKTAIKRLSAGKNSVTVKWKRQKKQADGYEIAYSTSSGFPGEQTRTVAAGKNASSKTIPQLEAGKNYYVRLRAYKTVNLEGEQKRLYSGWSKVKTVEVQ